MFMRLDIKKNISTSQADAFLIHHAGINTERVGWC